MYIGHNFFNLVIDILFIIFSYIYILVINLMFFKQINVC